MGVCPEVTEEGRMISVAIQGLRKRKIQRKKGDVSHGWLEAKEIGAV